MGKSRSSKPGRVRQVCVIPFRRFGDDTAFSLITSLRKRRWIFPKGAVEAGESLHETALKEAREEAGLYGRIVGPSLGSYEDSKRDAILDVTALLMEVERSDEAWEEDVRLRCWIDGRGALRLLDKPQLRRMLRRAMWQLAAPHVQAAGGPVSDRVVAGLASAPTL